MIGKNKMFLFQNKCYIFENNTFFEDYWLKKKLKKIKCSIPYIEKNNGCF